MAKTLEEMKEIATQQSNEAKRLLGQFVVDQVVADRIVDCIIGAAIMEVPIMVKEATNA